MAQQFTGRGAYDGRVGCIAFAIWLSLQARNEGPEPLAIPHRWTVAKTNDARLESREPVRGVPVQVRIGRGRTEGLRQLQAQRGRVPVEQQRIEWMNRGMTITVLIGSCALRKNHKFMQAISRFFFLFPNFLNQCVI